MKNFIPILFVFILIISCDTEEVDNHIYKDALINQYFGYIDDDKEFSICVDYHQSTDNDIITVNSVNNYNDEFNLYFDGYSFILDTIESQYWDYSPDGTDSCLATSTKTGYGKFIPDTESIELTIIDKLKWCSGPVFYDTTYCIAINNNLIEYEGIYYHFREDFNDSVYITKDTQNDLYQIKVTSDRLEDDSVIINAELGCTGLIGLDDELNEFSYCVIHYKDNYLEMTLPFYQKGRDTWYTFKGNKVGQTNLP